MKWKERQREALVFEFGVFLRLEVECGVVVFFGCICIVQSIAWHGWDFFACNTAEARARDMDGVGHSFFCLCV